MLATFLRPLRYAFARYDQGASVTAVTSMRTSTSVITQSKRQIVSYSNSRKHWLARNLSDRNPSTMYLLLTKEYHHS